jgi:DNA repair exonuclease SbcCD nuclease subunit
MTRKILIITDTHLTDIPSESYRWDIFKIVKKEIKKHGYTDLFHLGDIFDKKDKHRSELVNRLVDEFTDISRNYCPITILQGNHCYVVKQDEGFLRFLGKKE